LANREIFRAKRENQARYQGTDSALGEPNRESSGKRVVEQAFAMDF
jgi:hypothetical protein